MSVYQVLEEKLSKNLDRPIAVAALELARKADEGDLDAFKLLLAYLKEMGLTEIYHGRKMDEFTEFDMEQDKKDGRKKR